MRLKTFLQSANLFMFGFMFLSLVLPATPVLAQEEPTAGMLFIEAFNNKDEATMKKLIETRADEFPLEVKDMVGYAMSPDASPDEQDFLFFIAGLIAKMHGEHTGDQRLMAAVQANHAELMERRGVTVLAPEAVDKTKKELNDLGKGDWRVLLFELDGEGALVIEVDVNESSGGDNFVPTVNFKISQKAKEIIKANLPNVKKGKITWVSMGVGLKTAFLD